VRGVPALGAHAWTASKRMRPVTKHPGDVTCRLEFGSNVGSIVGFGVQNGRQQGRRKCPDAGRKVWRRRPESNR
jgi:hypothetical protein